MHFLGIEIGHAMTRVLALDVETATVSATASAAHEWIEGLPEGCAEQDPAEWIRAADHAVRETLEALGPRRVSVSAIGVTAPAGGMVALDESDHIVRPAKLAADRSAAAQVEALGRAFGGSPGMIEMTGNPLDAGSMAARALWLKEHEPRHFTRAAQLLTPQDFLAYWLSGERGTSASTAATTGLFEVPERSWCRPLIEFIDPGLAAMLPPGLEPARPRGVLRPGLAGAWGLGDRVWIAPGAGAQAAAIFAAGLGRPGEMAADLAAEGSLAALSQRVLVDFLGEGEVGCDLGLNAFTRMPQRNVVAAPELVRRHCGWSTEEFGRALAAAEPGADGLLFLPYLRGEAVPRLPEAGGLLHGITLNNFTPGNLARAAAEGVALGFGYAMSRLHDIGHEAAEVRLTRDPGASGGQLLADVFGVPVVTVKGGGGALLGAAMQAAAVSFHEEGEDVGFDEIASYVVAADEETRRQPDPERHAFYQELLARQQYLAETLHGGGFM